MRPPLPADPSAPPQRGRRHKSTAILAAVLALGLVATACGGTAPTTAKGTAAASSSATAGSAASTAASPAGNTLVVSQISTGVSLIPAFTTTGEDTEMMNQIYDSLLQVKPGTTDQIEPDLATSYTISPDGKTYTFQLRKGVKWQGGYGDFTCSDVQFTWNFNKDKANASFWQSEASIVTSVDCPDPYTAVIHLSSPFLGFVWYLVNLEPSTGWVMSKAAWAKLGKTGYNATPIGTGPYMLKQKVPNSEVVLVANPDYWGTPPAIKTIDFKVIADAQTAALAVKTGAVDIAGIDGVTADQYKSATTAHLVVKPALFTDWLEINTTVPPFNNRLVREAMSYAIDYKGMVTDVLRGYGTPGYNGMILPGQTGFDASVNPQNTYDPAKAKQLLQQSGVKLPITGFFTTYNDTEDVNAGQFISADFQAVGINMQSRPLERGTLVQERIKATTPASIIGDTLAPDPDALFPLTFISAGNPPAGLNIARYSGVDQLYQEQHTTASQSARLKLLSQIQAQMVHDVPAIDLYVGQDIWLVNNRVQNFLPQVLFGGDALDLVTLSGS
ncbi:MAG TPA: ABC transporter substrate-binding protein [Bacillota bacterium]|nr:ABC transporter substrate-binding protein [Bacillota bacterium]